jgi:hypothetical protein
MDVLGKRFDALDTAAAEASAVAARHAQQQQQQQQQQLSNPTSVLGMFPELAVASGGKGQERFSGQQPTLQQSCSVRNSNLGSSSAESEGEGLSGADKRKVKLKQLKRPLPPASQPPSSVVHLNVPHFKTPHFSTPHLKTPQLPNALGFLSMDEVVEPGTGSARMILQADYQLHPK